jgi:hypothetical protein
MDWSDSVAPSDRRPVRAVPNPDSNGKPRAGGARSARAGAQSTRPGAVKVPSWDDQAWPDAPEEEAAWPGRAPARERVPDDPFDVAFGPLDDVVEEDSGPRGTRPPVDGTEASQRRRRARLVLIGALVVGLAALGVGMRLTDNKGRAGAVAPVDEHTIVVSLKGSPAGDGSPAHPYRSIQQALVEARAGETVQVGAGTYEETLRSVRPGRPGAPIRLVGQGARIVGPDNATHLVELTHDNVELRGFDLSRAKSIVWVIGTTGVKVMGNTIHEASGECVRVRGGAIDNEIGGNRISNCGLTDFSVADDHKNGEGIYIGTAPEQLDEGKNPTIGPDASNGNWVHGNVVRSRAECVDIKEHALGNRIEGNRCSAGEDPDSGMISVRGDANVIRGNVLTGGKGGGIRLGGDTGSDGLANVVTGNTMSGNATYGLIIRRRPQGAICGNTVTGNGQGTVNVPGLDPAAACGP